MDGKGNIYGATANGLVFRLSPALSGDGWVFKELYDFDSSATGIFLGYQGALLLAKNGHIYQPATVSGQSTVIYDVVPPGSTGGPWTANLIYTFAASDQAGGVQRLNVDALGRLYGVSSSGGYFNAGFIFRLSPPTAEGESWKRLTLHTFRRFPTDGKQPSGGMLFRDGVFYGVTDSGGIDAYGGSVNSLVP